MRDAMSNIGLMESVWQALKNPQRRPPAILINLKPVAALGNGGLGRTRRLLHGFIWRPAEDPGPRLRASAGANGMFRQEMSEGWQVELLARGLAGARQSAGVRAAKNRPMRSASAWQRVLAQEPDGSTRLEWRPSEAFPSPPHSIRRSPAGVARGVNTLRLWSAQPVDPIMLEKFNSGDHIGALEESSRAEAITRVLYPV